MGKNRNFFIDMVKGVAIFLMLWGHCIQYCTANSEVDFFGNYVFKYIYAFHMPLFMLVSGYLFFCSFSKRSLEELLIHKTQSLLQPIIMGTIFCYFATTVFFGALQGSFSAAFNGQWINELPSLWFLWSVLASSLAVAVVCKKCASPGGRIILLLAAVPVVAMFPNTNMNLYMYPYFVLGFYFAKYKDRLPARVLAVKYAALPLFPLLMCFYEKKHYIYTTGLFPNADYSMSEMLVIDAYRWLIGLVGSVFVITVLQLLYRHVTLKRARPVVSRALARLGECSIKIYVFSVPFLSTYLSVLFPKALSVLNMGNIFVKKMFVYNFVFTPLLAAAYALALYWMVKLLEKAKITGILFGK